MTSLYDPTSTFVNHGDANNTPANGIHNFQPVTRDLNTTQLSENPNIHIPSTINMSKIPMSMGPSSSMNINTMHIPYNKNYSTPLTPTSSTPSSASAMNITFPMGRTSSTNTITSLVDPNAKHTTSNFDSNRLTPLNPGLPLTSINYLHNRATTPIPQSYTPSNYNINPISSMSNKVGFINKLNYNDKEGVPIVSTTPNRKSPISPLFFNNNSSSNLAAGGRSSVMYPLTPQTLMSYGKSPSLSSTPPIYEPNTNNNNTNNYRFALTNNNEIKRLRESSNTESCDNDDCDKQGNHGGYSSNPLNKQELYYEMESKTYVSKTKEEGREGVRNGTLIKVDSTNDGNKKKKLSSDDNDDDSDDSDNNDDHDDKDNKSTSSAKSKTKRSRGGCLTCRQRKKRCCETKPVCSECQRLNIKCRWPVPGSERKNKSKNQPHMSHDEVYHEVYGVIKVLRGVVDYKIEQ